jgi:hypothetical protein
MNGQSKTNQKNQIDKRMIFSKNEREKKKKEKVTIKLRFRN